MKCENQVKNVRNAFFASPQFPRLLKADAVTEAIARGVREGLLAYVGKTSGDKYEPFEFKNSNFQANDVEISDDLFILKGEEAEDYLIKITDPPKLTKLLITPTEIKLKPETVYTFKVEGKDQYDQPFTVEKVNWTTTGGEIDSQGVLNSPKDIGSFLVTAKVDQVQAETRFTVFDSNDTSSSSSGDTNGTTETGTTGEQDSISESQGISWQGEITPQKWMQFYTK